MKNKWLWIAVIVIFAALAPVDATNMLHGLIAFVQNLLSSFHLH